MGITHKKETEIEMFINETWNRGETLIQWYNGIIMSEPDTHHISAGEGGFPFTNRTTRNLLI